MFHKIILSDQLKIRSILNIAICKQITRKQSQFLKQSEIKISKDYNLFFADTRNNLASIETYNQERYKDDFVWNANELWETQVPALRFWKKDGRVDDN